MSSQMSLEIKGSALGPVQGSEGQWSREYLFGPGFIGFKGHFPHSPILPGVVQFGLALDILEQALGVELEIAEIPKAKFSRLLGPEVPIQGTVQTDLAQAPFRADCRLYLKGEQAAEFRLVLQDKR
jgi:3-hydroxymyristoyl/3-hydroxydecanoyl-(acyl carrier protein) dehydratase